MMKIKIDENLPARLVAMLSDLGHDVDTVVAEGLKTSFLPKTSSAGRGAWLLQPSARSACAGRSLHQLEVEPGDHRLTIKAVTKEGTGVARPVGIDFIWLAR
jgi:hypothetical protein